MLNILLWKRCAVMKKIICAVLSMLITVSTVSSTFAFTYGHNAGVLTQYELTDVKGVVFSSFDLDEVVFDDTDLNFLADSISLQPMADNSIRLDVVMGDELVTFVPKLYLSKFFINPENTIIRVVDDLRDSTFELINFRIEKDANSISLLKPNIYLEGETVLSLGIYNPTNQDIYFFQTSLDNFDMDNLLLELSKQEKSDYSDDELLNKEIDYLTLKINEPRARSTNTISNFFISEQEILQNYSTDTTLDEMIRLSDGKVVVMSEQRILTHAGISSSVFRNAPYNQWSDHFYGWTTPHGYSLYCMRFAGTDNKILYFMRYYISFGVSGNVFNTSFSISHNIQVLYNIYTGELGIFDDRTSAAHITIDPTIWAAVHNTRSNTGGYIQRGMYTLTQNASWRNNIPVAIMGMVPRLDVLYSVYETLKQDGPNATTTNK